jgi:hypothetical protein
MSQEHIKSAAECIQQGEKTGTPSKFAKPKINDESVESSRAEINIKTSQDAPELDFRVSTASASENSLERLQTAETALIRPCAACKTHEALRDWDTCNLCTGLAIQAYMQYPQAAQKGWASYAELKDENERLRAAIINHRSQKADDRCWMDDEELYKVLGDCIEADFGVGDKAAMLKNCERFLEQRCVGGNWPSYAELERRLAQALAEKAYLENAVNGYASRDVGAKFSARVVYKGLEVAVDSLEDLDAIVERIATEQPRSLKIFDAGFGNEG